MLDRQLGSDATPIAASLADAPAFFDRHWAAIYCAEAGDVIG